MNHEERVVRVQLGLIRLFRSPYDAIPGDDDHSLLRSYGEKTRPLAEALVDVIEDVQAHFDREHGEVYR